MNPALTDEQRAAIKLKLDRVGKPKVYGGKAIVPPPAPAPPEDIPADDDDTEEKENPSALDDLLAQSKDELLALAEGGDVEVRSSWTKAKIAEAILNAMREN